MRSKAKHYLIILAIICISLVIGMLTSLVWEAIDKATHPDDYSELVAKYSAEYNIPEYIIFAVIKVESDFDPEACSSVGAMGLMQMMPSTFEWLTGDEHLDEGLRTVKLYDPEVSIKYGTYYLKYLYSKFDYNWDNTFAAYNGGEGNVREWLADGRYSDGKGNLTDIPFKETKKYVDKVNSEIDTYKKIYSY